jgi:hypothetical protein
MYVFTCKTMRTAVLSAAVLLLLGVLLLSPVIFMSRPIPQGLWLLVYPGFAALLMSPVVLLVTALTSLIPSVNARLQNCQH